MGVGKSGGATEWTSQQILDKVNEEDPVDQELIHTELLKEILEEIRKINIYLAEITGDEI